MTADQLSVSVHRLHRLRLAATARELLDRDDLPADIAELARRVLSSRVIHNPSRDRTMRFACASRTTPLPIDWPQFSAITDMSSGNSCVVVPSNRSAALRHG